MSNVLNVRKNLSVFRKDGGSGKIVHPYEPSELFHEGAPMYSLIDRVSNVFDGWAEDDFSDIDEDIEFLRKLRNTEKK